MKYDSIFDVIGHIMVGPSSSHTFGAGRIGYIAQLILGGPPKRAEIYLHGSFAATFKGHGTDKAILAGLLSIPPDDERLREAYSLAKKYGLKFSFKKIDLGAGYHPNSVKLVLHLDSDVLSLVGSSIGGGNIIITEIDGMQAGFNGDHPTIITFHKDTVGVIAKITSNLVKYGYNIERMSVSRNIKIGKALCWIEVNKHVKNDLIEKLKEIPEIEKVRVLNV